MPRITPLNLRPGLRTIENVGPFFDKRTGPIVAIAAGPLSQSDAQTLLGAVNWDAQRHLEREHVLRQEEQRRQPAGQHYSALHYRGSDIAGGGSWPSEARECCCGVISLGQFSAIPIRTEFISLDLKERVAQASPAGLPPTRGIPQTALKCLRNIGLGAIWGFASQFGTIHERLLIDYVSY